MLLKLGGGIISFPLLKDGPVYPMLKETWKEALKYLSLVFVDFDQLLLQRYFRVI